MKNAAHPTSFLRRRSRGRDVLANDGPGHKTCQNEQNNEALHEALNSPKTFLGCKIAVKPFMNSRMFSQSIGMRTLCVFVCCLVFALIDAAAKQRHCTFRVRAQVKPQDTYAFSMSANVRETCSVVVSLLH